MAVPYTFGTATAAIPLSQLDTNFATAITLGNTAVYLGNTTTSIGNLTLTNVTISSGSVTITDTTVSGNVTLSGGTANGVAYLNGSKVLTTGSALTFDGTTFSSIASATTAGNFKATSSTAQVLNVTASNDANTTVGLLVLGSAAGSIGMLGAGAPALYTAATELNLMANNASGVIKFAAGGSSEQMRLTNTGLGIKKSNPVCALDVVGIGQTSGNFLAGFGNTVADIVASSSVANGGAGFSEFLFGNASGNSRGYLSYSHAADALSIGTTGTTKATLDSSGNLGLGVTPSTGGYGVAFQIAQAGDGGAITAQAISANNYPVNLTANAISSGSSTWKYSNTDASSASRYQQVAGAHSWYTAPSGTAGNAITFTQAATLDASGHFMIGTTSTTGSASNDKIVAGGRFRTVSGSVSAATATATTLFTAPTALAAWLVTVNVDADSVLYSATYIVNTQGGSSTVATLIYKGSLISVSVSGYNVQATQTSGGTATIQYSAVRIF